MLLYKTGSFFKPHRDSEKEDGMFGTVVIQLPSVYDGGKLIVRHNQKTEEVDFSTTTIPQNGFSIFYTAFYCDCEHEVLLITSGIRACLVYNLVMTGELGQRPFPSATRIDREAREADLVDLLGNHWPNEQKIVYCLSHKYSQRNLSITNLKTTDRVIAQFFEKFAESCSLEVVIGILKRKKYRYANPKPSQNNDHRYDDDYDDYEVSSVDSNDPKAEFYDDYKMKHMKSFDRKSFDALPSMDIDFESEVVPKNCFADVKAFHDDEYVTGNEGVKCSKFYQCAAIMAFRHDDLVPILVKGDAKYPKVEEMFINEFQKYKDDISDENVKAKFLKWSHGVMDRVVELSRFYSEPKMQNSSLLLDSFLMLDDIELVQKYLKVLKFAVNLNLNFSYVHKICHKYDWATFSNEIVEKFRILKPDQRMECLQKFIEHENGSNNDANKQCTIHMIMKKMIDAFENELDHPPREQWYQYQPRPLKKEQRVDKTIKFLTSLWPLANKVHFLYLAEYAKLKTTNIIVPVLISLGQTENVSNELWIDVANHVKSKMEEYLKRAMVTTLNWEQNVSLSCHCKDCHTVQGFLHHSYQEIFDFRGKVPRRDHVKQILSKLDNLTHWTTAAGVLRIKKQKKTGQIEVEEREFILTSLLKLCSLITSINGVPN